MITAKSQLMNHSNLTINRAVLRPPYTQSIEALFGPQFPNWLISTSYKTAAINLAEDTWHRLLLPHPQSLLSCQGGNWVLLMWFILDIFLLTSTFLSFITEVLAKILFDYLFHDLFIFFPLKLKFSSWLCNSLTATTLFEWRALSAWGQGCKSCLWWPLSLESSFRSMFPSGFPKLSSPKD